MLFLDIETTAIVLGGLPSVIHFCAVSEDGGPARMVTQSQLRKLVRKHKEIVAHNGAFFDFPVLTKVWGIDFSNNTLLDTLLLSFVCAPHVQLLDDQLDLQPKKYRGRHSLKAWGLRLKFPKDDYTGGWDVPNEEMRVYCLRDVDVLVKLYQQLVVSTFFNSEVVFREHAVHFQMADIFLRGVPIFGLDALRKMIVGDMEDAVAEIRGMGFEGNLNSRQQVAKFLREVMSWEPDEFTSTGLAKVNHETLEEFPAFVKYYATQKPLSQLATLMKKEVAGRVHPTISTSSTRTGRCSHTNPNIGQIPAVQEAENRWEAKYGQEFRALFHAPEGYVMVGADLSSLELRCMAEALHSFSGSATWVEMLEAGEDIHKQNQELLGLVNRTDAKRFIFACVPMETEVLTRSGWKKYANLSVGEDVMTYNAADDVKEWSPVLEKMYYPEAPVTTIQVGKSFKVRATPDHRWFVQRRTGRGDKRYTVHEVRTTQELNTECTIITNAPFRNNTPASEGVFTHTMKYDTPWVHNVLQMSNPQLNAFMAGFCAADGYSSKRRLGTTKWQFCQNDGEIFTAAQLGAYLMHDGHIATHLRDNKYYTRKDGSENPDMYYCHFSHKRGVTMQKGKTVTSDTVEPVWCIRTANESFVMRQGKTITITGNSIYGAGPDKISLILGISRLDANKALMRAKSKIPGYQKTRQKLEQEAKTKNSIILPNGRRLFCPKPFTAFNTYLQGLGSEVAKYWLLNIAAETKKQALDARMILFVHDELQFLCAENDVDKLTAIIYDAVEKVKGQLGTRIAFDCDVKTGRTWKETH